MAGEKYGKYVKELSFRNDLPGFYRQVTELSGAPFGLDFHVQYGVYQAPGYMGGKPYRPHKHDYNQVMFWLGADTGDMGDLGAEVELYLGEEGEKHMVTSTTAVAVPAGIPHFPANITRMDKRFIFMTVSCAPECREIALPAGGEKDASQPATIFDAKYRENIINVAFIRKSAWHYGPKNPDDSGGSLAFIRGRDPKFDFLIMCESLKKAPYRFGPEPDKPHAHTKLEILFFIGTDLNDITQLGGEAEIYLGKEMERYVINKPTAVVIPGKVPHNPLVITRVDRPFILCDVRPLGTDLPSFGKL
jgi:uncharacterized RmlC-like cupin family protein